MYERLRYDAYGNPSHLYPEDMNGDGSLNFFDNTPFNSAYANQDPRADFNFDGAFNFFDASAYASAFSTKGVVGSGWISDEGAAGPSNPLGYMGYQWDPEAGLWLGRSRVYSPDLGRWMQRDPAGYVDGLSLYLFVRGNPLSYMDPMGLCADEELNGNTGHHADRDNGGGLKRARANNNGRESEYKQAEDQYHLIESYLRENGEHLKKTNPELYLKLILQQKMFEIQRTAIKRYGSLEGDAAQQSMINAYNEFFQATNSEVAGMVREIYGPTAVITGAMTAGLGGAALARFTGQADDLVGALKAANGGESADDIRQANIAKGIPESQLGPSGKPKVHNARNSTRKKAKDRARQEGGGTPVHHPNDAGQDPHFHAVDHDGKKKTGKDNVHYTYPPSQSTRPPQE